MEFLSKLLDSSGKSIEIKKEANSISAKDVFFKNIFSVIRVSERGIPFLKNWGFPKLSPWYITNCEYPPPNVSFTVEYQ